MQIGQAQDLTLQGRHRRTSVGATLVVARSMLLVSKTQCVDLLEAPVSLLLEVGFQFLAEQFASAVQARLDRRLRDAQSPRGLLCGEVLDIAQHQHRTQRVGQLRHRLLHALAQVVLNNDGFRILRVLVYQLAQDCLPLLRVQRVIQRVEAV